MPLSKYHMNHRCTLLSHEPSELFLWRMLGSSLLLLLLSSSIIEASGLSHVASCHNGDCFRKSKFHSVWLYKKINSCTSVLPNTCAWEQQDRNKTLMIKDKKARRIEWMWNEAQWARKSPVNLNVKSHLSSSSHVSHSRQSVKKGI